MRNLAIFDLDNTLLAGDSDFLWGHFLVAQGLVERKSYEQENQRFLDEYRQGTLDIHEFLNFSLQPLAQTPLITLQKLHQQFMSEKIIPIISQEARRLLADHRRRGHFLLIITATNRFITEPIARELGVDDLLATDPELINGKYSGRVAGIPCFQGGKVIRLQDWLKNREMTLDSSWFYSDSHNDLPLLEKVTHPIAVDPDETLAAHAATKQWPIISLLDNR